MALLPEEYTDDKEQVGADPAEVAQRRAAMRANSVDGGGEGGESSGGNEDSRSHGGLHSVTELPGGPSDDAAATERAAASGKAPQDPFDKAVHHLASAAGAYEFAKRHKKRILIGLIGGGGALGILLAAFIAFLPLKLEDLMKNELEKRVTNKIDYMMEERADKLVIRYLFERAGVKTGSGIVVESSLVKTLYGNWKLGKFEDNFTKNTGYRLEPIIKDGKIGSGIRLVAPDGDSTDFYKPEVFEQYLGSNKGLDARSFIRTITRDQTKWYQVIQRRNLRRFMRNAYSIHKWSFFTGKEDENDAENEVASELQDSAAGPYEEGAPKVLDCAMGDSDCPSDDGTVDDPDASVTAAPGTVNASNSDAAQASDTSSAIKDAYNKARAYTPNSLIQKGLTKVLSKFIGEELAKEVVGKAATGIGAVLLVDEAARINHFFDSGKADATIRALHKVEYATEFSQFQTIASNFNDPSKQMSSNELDSVMQLFNGAEGSAAYHQVIDGTGGGQGVDPSLGVNDTSTPIEDEYNYLFPPEQPLIGGLDVWYTVIDGNAAGRAAINTLNTVTSVGATLALDFIKLTIGPAYTTLTNGIGSLMSRMLFLLVKPAVDGTEVGADLFNAIDIGASVVGQDFSAALGGHVLSLAQSNQMQLAIASDVNQNDPAPASLTARMFSTNYDNSVVNKMVMAMPGSFSDALNQTANASLAAIQNPISVFKGLFTMLSKPAYAANDANLWGLNDIGATSAELNEPIDDAGLDAAASAAAARLGTTLQAAEQSQSSLDALLNATQGSDCPNVAAGTLNRCRLDLATIQSMNSVYTNDDDGGLNDSASSGTSGSSGSTATAPTTTAGATIDMSSLYDDSTGVACAPGTKDLGIGDGYHNNVLIKIRLCGLPNLKSSGTSVSNAGGLAVVNSRVSGAWYALVQAADQSGTQLSAISSFRTMADQQSLCPCDGVTVAKPGTSNHQMGLAIDINIGDGSNYCPSHDGQGNCTAPASANWNWMHTNAANFGLHQYSLEAWHWSPTGD